MRDITLEDTFKFDFSTRAFATGIPTTLSGTPVLSVHEEGNDTFITSGVSVDVDIGTSPVTGLNEGTVVATAANGYEAGKSYSVFISTGTVGGVSAVGEVVHQFTIGLSAAAVDLANGTDGLGAIKADTAAVLIDTGTTIPATITTAQNDLDTITGSDGVTVASGTQTFNLSGNVTGSVGSLVGHTVQTADHTANIASILTDTGTTIPATIATVDTNVDAILVDTGTTLPASIATIDTNVDSILVDTGTTIPATIATAQADLDTITGTGGVIIGTDTMTEAYAADGAAASMPQLQYMIWSALSEFAIAGTTVTCKKLDGSTTAMTFTLDDGTDPTSRTRAT